MTLLAAGVHADSHEQWLEKLEKAAGAGLEELQKQSIEASKKSEQAATARRAAADRQKREEKDVSSRHLQNFFNNLLSRPEKTRSTRAMSDKKVVCYYHCTSAPRKRAMSHKEPRDDAETLWKRSANFILSSPVLIVRGLLT
uniref:Uncharacterized protein n=1 Tax=Hyaloperonospora arabidopsidis (strain Emoy2) TaxID=559515 RepID=M4BRF3_HYAAE